MKVLHTISRAIQAPKPEKVYGARIVDIHLGGSSVTVVWAIFGRKNRKRRSKLPLVDLTKGKKRA